MFSATKTSFSLNMAPSNPPLKWKSSRLCWNRSCCADSKKMWKRRSPSRKKPSWRWNSPILKRNGTVLSWRRTLVSYAKGLKVSSKEGEGAIVALTFFILPLLLANKEMPHLRNIMMQLRKCCIHPYLLEGAEEVIVSECNAQSPQDQFNCLVQSSGKLVKIYRHLKVNRSLTVCVCFLGAYW